MISAITAVPLSIGSIGVPDYRSRPSTGEHPLLADSAPVAQKTPGPGEDGAFPQREQPAAQPPLEPPTSGTIFAAAVLSGALTPTPQTLGELYARIGASQIPESSELRLRDLQV